MLAKDHEEFPDSLNLLGQVGTQIMLHNNVVFVVCFSDIFQMKNIVGIQR